MAVGLPLPANVMAQLSSLWPVAIGYFLLIALLALIAVFSPEPHRRKAAQDVLRILVPGRRRDTERRSRAIRPRAPDERSSPPNRPVTDDLTRTGVRGSSSSRGRPAA
jgi:hypothetical protein